MIEAKSVFGLWVEGAFVLLFLPGVTSFIDKQESKAQSITNVII